MLVIKIGRWRYFCSCLVLGEGYKASSRKRYKVLLNFLAKEFIGKGSYTGVSLAGA